MNPRKHLRDAASIRNAEEALDRSLAADGPVSVGRVLWPTIRPYALFMVLGLLFNALHGMAISFQNLAPKWLISDVLKPVGLSPAERLRRAIGLGLLYLLVSAVGRMLVWHVGYRFFTWVRERIVFILRARFFRHVNHLCLRFHGHRPSGEIFNFLFGSPLAQFMHFYQHTSMHVAGAVVTIISTLLVIGLWDPVLTGVLLATAVAAVVVMQWSRGRIKALQKDYQETESGISATVADVLRGNRAVKLYAMEDHVAADFDRSALLLGRKSYHRDIRVHIEYMKYETTTYVAYAILLVTATWRYLGGHVDEGIVAAYLNSFTGIVGPLSMIYTAFTLWGGAQASVERIGTVMKTASTTPDPDAEVAASPAAGPLEFDRVTFAYEPGGEPVLRDFALRIPYGQRIALVGPSGAGKTTVIQLALRFYDPQQGAVRLNGCDLRRMRGADLRRLFGVVPQDPFIFRTTIRENIRVSRPEAMDPDIVEACRRANAWEFIEAMPHGLDERVGEGGSTLSGGQRQRLAIARAMLADPPFYILDEATSALDTLSERLIQSTIEREFEGRTVIIIAHRLATVKHCDRILVMSAGQVVEDGHYEELTQAQGLFAALVNGQRLS